MATPQVMVPCLAGSTCQLDWVAIAAIGGWFAALTTLLAILVALRTASKQIEVANRAVEAERAKALEIQEREWNAQAAANVQTAARLAHAFSRELRYAGRTLLSKIADWEPVPFRNASMEILESFAKVDHFPKLKIIDTFSGRLDGFADEDAFLLLSVLAAWNFYSASPGIPAEQLVYVGEETREKMARKRCEFGLRLHALIDQAIERLQPYFIGRAQDIYDVDIALSDAAVASIVRIREDMERHGVKI
ncbi:hypothetical protein IB227_02340 [Stenotrophomonas sp. STM01]|uniref:hypothetical protein n=1 Tax=Stenotrophomonas sp. STM01 TaxID=2769278 RepID=UPI0017859A3B|nr:hypothetical protein [Stenotrophomonas sp. STM01]MBD9534689.1 hypothetical protein [Stenotrophomonas sp. STM01]